MKFSATPRPDAQGGEAIGHALETLLGPDPVPAAYRSAWRKAGLLENVAPREAPQRPAERFARPEAAQRRAGRRRRRE